MPNPSVLAQKQAFVEELANKIKNAGAGVLVDYKGINVADDTKLRRDMRKAGVEYSVIKNTLLNLAFQKAGLEPLTEHLKGTTALALGTEDQIAPAKILCEYAKKSNDKFKIKAGFVDGRPITAAEVSALASLPPREILVSKVLGSLNAPISGLVNVLNGNIRGLVVALNAISEKKAAG